MFGRQRTGSVVCPSCGNLVGVNDERCFTCGRWNPGLWGFTPALRRLGADFGFAETVTAACVLLYVLMLLYSGSSIRMNGLLGFLAPDQYAMVIFGASGALPVFGYGRWWTVLSAGWLHGGLLHILFNMMWVRQLGPACVDLFGTGRTIIIYTVGSVVGFAMSSIMGYLLGGVPILGGSMLTLGASAPIFGLLGALVHYGRQSSSLVKTQAAGYAATLFLFGLLMPGVDNWAHGGGFIGGYLASYILNPMRPERGNHLIIAFVCLLATVASVLASLIVR
jgi:membrane associated rhomboid family serine protease